MTFRLTALASVAFSGALFATPTSVDISNNNDPFVTNPLNVDRFNEAANIQLGGFKQVSSRLIVVDNNPADLILTNFTLISDGPNSVANKTIRASGYNLPNPAARAWHVLHGIINLPGPAVDGNWAEISLAGLLDGNPTGGITLRINKAEQAKLGNTGNTFEFNVASKPVEFDPPLNPQHTRRVDYVFTTGPDSQKGAFIRLPESSDNPFDGGVPEPGSMALVGGGLMVASGALRRARRSARQRKTRQPRA